MEAQDILFGSGASTAGLTTKVFWGYSADVKTWPKPKGDAALGDQVTADAAVVMKTGKKMGVVEVTYDENDLKYKLAGQIGSKGYKQEISLYRAGQDDAFNAWTAAVKNRGVFLIIPDKNDNLFFMGSEFVPCFASDGEGGLGNNLEGKNGNGITFVTESNVPLLKYPFAVPLTVGV